MQINTFWLNFCGLCLEVTLKIRSRSSKPIQLCIMSKCYIHANLVKIRLLVHKILCTQAPFGSIWQFKSCSDLEKYLKVTKTKSALHHVPKCCWNLPTSSWDMVHICTFWLKFGSLSPAVTLKIMSRSPKSNQLFIMSQCYIQTNLLRIHPSVHEIVQTRKCQADTNTDANSICTKNNMSLSPSVNYHLSKKFVLEYR